MYLDLQFGDAASHLFDELRMFGVAYSGHHFIFFALHTQRQMKDNIRLDNIRLATVLCIGTTSIRAVIFRASNDPLIHSRNLKKNKQIAICN